MHLLRTVRNLGLLVAAVSATLAVWLAAAPPATTTLAPGAMGAP